MSFCVNGSGSPGGDADLRLDQVDAGDHFGHRMFDLDAGVHFDEVEVVVLVDDELDGAGVGVVGRLDQPHGRFAHRLRESCRGRFGAGAFFDQLLVAALRRAIAFPQVDHVAVVVGQDLHFDVARVARRISPGRRRRCRRPPRLRRGPAAAAFLSARSFARHAHALAAAAGRRLDQHRKADLVGDLHGLVLVLDQAVAAGHDRHVGLAGQLAGRVFLSPSRFIASGVGPMKSMLQLRQTSLKCAFSARKP